MKEKTKAIACIICSAFCFTFMNIFVRLSGDLPSMQKSFFRNLVAAIIALAIMIKNKDGFRLRKRNLPFFFMRAFFGTIGILCNFYAVDCLTLSNASMLNKMSPFFVLIFSYFILKEKLKPFQLIAVIIAFAGCLFVIKPTLGNIDLIPSLIGLLGGACAGLAYTFVRVLGTRGEKGSSIVLFFSAFSCVVLLPWLIINGQPMSAKQLIFLLGAGLSAAGGQFSITAAYSHAPGREISVYDYSQILFSALFGFIFFGDIPDALSFVGYALIIGAAVAMFIYKNKSDGKTEASD